MNKLDEKFDRKIAIINKNPTVENTVNTRVEKYNHWTEEYEKNLKSLKTKLICWSKNQWPGGYNTGNYPVKGTSKRQLKKKKNSYLSKQNRC